MVYTDLRQWLKHLDATGRLAVAKEGISLEHRLAAVAKALDGEQATLFPKAGGMDIPVVSGFISNRAWIAEAMGVPQPELLQHFLEAAARPIPWREVPSGRAPCQEVVFRGRELGDLRAHLPIPIHSEHDSGPYLTGAIVVAKNPSTGVQNVSMHRIQVTSPDRLGICMLPRHLWHFFREAEARGEALEVAIVIGLDPLTLLASQAIAPLDVDEFHIAGALHGKPLEMVKCLSSEIRVPAASEIVIEGRILPGVREKEGPFGEFPRYYSSSEQREVIAVDCLTHRKSPVYHTIVPAEREHLLLGAVAREATLLAHLQRSFPNVLDVHLSLGGVGRYHLFIKLRKTHEGQPRNVMCAAMGAHYDIKHVVVLDEDVDIHDPSQVEWAIATRFQADRDLIVVPGTQGSLLDPSTTKRAGGGQEPPHTAGTSAKMGLDATRPLVYDEHIFTKVTIPGEDEIDLGQELLANARVEWSEALGVRVSQSANGRELR